MEHDQVMAWVDGYIAAWRDEDVTGVARLFDPDVRYRVSPYAKSLVGHAAVEEFWLDDAGKTFTAEAEPVAVDGDAAVVRVEVHYGGDKPQDYRDLWLLHFAADGRADDFEEWAFVPGKTYSIEG